MSGQRGSQVQCLRDGMGALKSRKNAFGAGETDDRIESGCVGMGKVLGPAGVVKGCMLGSDGGVIEAGRDGMRERDLAVFILQNVGEGSLQDSWSAALETRCVLTES